MTARECVLLPDFTSVCIPHEFDPQLGNSCGFFSLSAFGIRSPSCACLELTLPAPLPAHSFVPNTPRLLFFPQFIAGCLIGAILWILVTCLLWTPVYAITALRVRGPQLNLTAASTHDLSYYGESYMCGDFRSSIPLHVAIKSFRVPYSDMRNAANFECRLRDKLYS